MRDAPCGESSLCLVPDELNTMPGVFWTAHRGRATASGQQGLAKMGPNVLHPKAGTLPKAKRELQETWREMPPYFAPHLLELRPLQTSVGDLCPPLPKPSTILPYIPEEKCLHYLPPSSPLAKQTKGGL